MNCSGCSIDEALKVLYRGKPEFAGPLSFLFSQAMTLSVLDEKFIQRDKAHLKSHFISNCQTLYEMEAEQDCLGQVFEGLIEALPAFIECLGSEGRSFFVCLIPLLPVAIQLIVCLINKDKETTSQRIDFGTILGCAVKSLDFKVFIECLQGDSNGGDGGGSRLNPSTERRC